eukprot:190867_1
MKTAFDNFPTVAMLQFISSTILFIVCKGQPTGDLITNLPGLTWNVNYKQYSGYLDASSTNHLHYWFQESQNNPETDPIVLWLNGGPGCSSLDGLLYEQGSIHVYDNGTLWKNVYSWNLNASMIYMEAPICVGFSYQDGTTNCHQSDNGTATDNYHAILDFLKKFPQYQKNDFYVTGESYGGVYVPTLTLKILQGNAAGGSPKVNLKGFAVGNGVTKSELMSEGLEWFKYHHGFFSEPEWDAMQQACCKSPYTRKTCTFTSGNSACRTAVNNANSGKTTNLNGYNIYGDCYRSHSDPSDPWKIDEDIKRRMDEANELYSWKKYTHHMRMLKGEKWYEENLKGVPPCLDSKGAITYLNRVDVKNALHVKTSITWDICSDHLSYTRQYGDLTATYKAIFAADSTIYATVYNGDTDTSCNFLGDSWFVNDLNLPQTKAWREWTYNDVAGTQVGGWTRDFQRLHFVTVRGSGHMVPQYRPSPALKMFNAFLANQNL